MRRENGFTMIELLIAMVISGFLLMGVVQLLLRQQETFQTQNQVVDVQQNMRSALIRFQYELRMVAHGVLKEDIASAVAFNGDGGCCASDQLVFLANLSSASTVIKNDGLPEWNPGCAGGGGGCYTFVPSQTITVPMTDVRSFEDPATPADEYPLSFRNITTRDEIARGTVIDVDFNNQQITMKILSGSTLNPGDYAGNEINVADPIIYLIDGAENLIRRQNPPIGDNIIAENIEDFQVEYGFDWDNDNQIDEVVGGSPTDEWLFNDPGDIPPINTDDLALIRVTLSFKDTNMDGDDIVREVTFSQAIRNLLLSKGMI